MAIKPPADSERAFHVRTDGGSLVSGHDTQEAADSDANNRNVNAAELGLRARYSVSPKPEAG